MPKSTSPNFESELRVYTIGTERVAWLGDLVASARADYKPRNFGERHLVDDLAIAKWRGLRVALMEKAVFEHQGSSFRPRIPKDKDGRILMPHEDIYHLAMAHAPEAHATVLAALNRLDSRYRQQFCTFLRLLIALRRGDPPPVPEAPPVEPKAEPKATANSLRKENPTCELSANTQPTT
jgi:hypothetical protein